MLEWQLHISGFEEMGPWVGRDVVELYICEFEESVVC